MLKGRVFHYSEEFKLESGQSLSGFQLFYTTWGKLNKERNNVIWVCHALTGNAFVKDWWGGLFGEGKLFDPEKHFIVCANVLGGCYGSTGPLSLNPDTNKPYYHSFPTLTNRDVVRSFDLLREYLGLEEIQTLLGGSLGGQHALEWAIYQPEVIKQLVQVAANAFQTPWGVAFNETQRMAIEQDVTWQLDVESAGVEGMKTARAVALLSYRTYNSYKRLQKETTLEKLDQFRASSYQKYQGEKLAKRFNAITYWQLTKMMDSHNVGRGRGSVEAALRSVKARTLVIGVESDILFPLTEQRFLAQYIPDSNFQVIHSDYGHDGFLLEFEQLNHILQRFLQHKEPRKSWIPTVF